MRMTLICAAAILGSTAATAQNSLIPTAKAAGQGTPTAVTTPSGSFLGGGGTCASPTVVPAGPTAVNFPFDLTAAASMGVATNAFEAICQHSGQLGIDNEEWWSWSATSDGRARMMTCSGLVGTDTKIAIYADDCPNITTLDPLSCKDDDPGCPTFETTIEWDITTGTNYLIQLGTFAAAVGGAGDFSIEELPALPAGQFDQGSTQNAFGSTSPTGGDVVWMNVYDAGAGEDLVSVDIGFSTPLALPGGQIDPDGTAATIVVYDGDPVNGLTFLGSEAIVTANTALDMPAAYTLTAPIAVTGAYTVGVIQSTASFFPAGIDLLVNSRGRAFLGWDDTGITPIDPMDPTTASVGPAEMQFGFAGNSDGVFMIRVHTVPSVTAFPEFCFGDGGDQMGCTNCPCGNNAPIGSGGGCLNSSGNGIRLIPSGSTSVSLPSGDTTDLRFGADGAPAGAFCILNSGDALAPGNMANPCFGLGSGAQAAVFDGLRCAITNTRRHGGRSADANGDVGVTNNPWGGEGGPPVGIAVAGGGFASGQTRNFQIINREDALAVCMRALNTSQAVEVTFTP